MTVDSEAWSIRFERLLEFAPDEVWASLTQSDRLSEWLVKAEVEPGQDGTITLDFGERGVVTCSTKVWDAPRSLVYTWDVPGRLLSTVKWELRVVDKGAATRLTLEHTLLEAGMAPGYGAGWHAHLDQLAGHPDGDVPDWEAVFNALQPRYAEIAAAAVASKS